MAAQINTYGGLKTGVLAWLARTGDALLDDRFDDFLLNCERRLYYGFATGQPDNPLRSDPLRVADMAAVNAAMALTETTAVPSGFLELITVGANVSNSPVQIVSEQVMDAYRGRTFGQPEIIAVSGTTFRVKDDPAGAAFTVRYYRKLATPAGSTVNAILTNYPDVYLYGCLIEAAIFSQDEAAAVRYTQLYNSSISGLNQWTAKNAASQAPVTRSAERTTP